MIYFFPASSSLLPALSSPEGLQGGKEQEEKKEEGGEEQQLPAPEFLICTVYL